MFFLSSCVPENIPTQDIYSPLKRGDIYKTYEGTIISTKNVIVEEADKVQDNSSGLMPDKALNQDLGNMFGKNSKSNTMDKSSTNLTDTPHGSYAQKTIFQHKATEYIIKLDIGSSLTIVQSKPTLHIGQRVFVIISGNKGRITPQNNIMNNNINNYKKRWHKHEKRLTQDNERRNYHNYSPSYIPAQKEEVHKGVDGVQAKLDNLGISRDIQKVAAIAAILIDSVKYSKKNTTNYYSSSKEKSEKIDLVKPDNNIITKYNDIRKNYSPYQTNNWNDKY